MALTADPVRLKAVNHLTYCVKDKTRALRFWEDVLGVKQIPSQVDSENIFWLQLPSGTMVHLIENEDAPSVPSHHGAFSFSIRCTIVPLGSCSQRIFSEST